MGVLRVLEHSPQSQAPSTSQPEAARSHCHSDKPKTLNIMVCNTIKTYWTVYSLKATNRSKETAIFDKN